MTDINNSLVQQAESLLALFDKQKMNDTQIIEYLEKTINPPADLALEWYQGFAFACQKFSPDLEIWALEKAYSEGAKSEAFYQQIIKCYESLGNINNAARFKLSLAFQAFQCQQYNLAFQLMIKALSISPETTIWIDLLKHLPALEKFLCLPQKGFEKQISILRKLLRKWLIHSLMGNEAREDYNLVVINSTKLESANNSIAESSLLTFSKLLNVTSILPLDTISPALPLIILWRVDEQWFIVDRVKTKSLDFSLEKFQASVLCANYAFPTSLSEGLTFSIAENDSSENLSQQFSRECESAAIQNLDLLPRLFADVIGMDAFANPLILEEIKSVISGAKQYVSTGKNIPDAFGQVINLYCQTNGWSNDFLVFLLMLFKPNYTLPLVKANSEVKSVLGPLNAKEIHAISNQIRDKGFFVFENQLADSIIEKLMSFAYSEKAELIPPREGVPEYAVYNPEKILADKYQFGSKDLLAQVEVQRLISDPNLLAISQAYLGTNPILSTLVMWWSTLYAKSPETEVAQLYHFDMDWIKWIKWFVYLTDVESDTGPHCFVEESHKRGQKPPELLQRGYQRISDEDMLKHYAENKFHEYTGPRGLIIAEDTRGFHKGKHPTKGHRLLLEIEYANTLCGTAFPRNTRLPEKIIPDIKEMTKAFPDIFSKFNF